MIEGDSSGITDEISFSLIKSFEEMDSEGISTFSSLISIGSTIGLSSFITFSIFDGTKIHFLLKEIEN